MYLVCRLLLELSPSPLSTLFPYTTLFRSAIDELFWRTDLSDKFSIIKGAHNIKFGGGWVHSVNTQVFRGFFTGRYIFSDVVGFLHYASPADRKSTRLNSSHRCISYAVFCLNSRRLHSPPSFPTRRSSDLLSTSFSGALT